MSASIGPRFPGGVWHTGLDLMTVFNFPRPLPQLLTLRLCHCLGSFISVLDVTFQYSANGLQTLLKCSYRAISLHCLFGLAAQLCVPFFFYQRSEVKLTNTSLNPKGHYQVIEVKTIFRICPFLSSFMPGSSYGLCSICILDIMQKDDDNSASERTSSAAPDFTWSTFCT